MKELIINILDEYLRIYQDERKRQKKLQDFIMSTNEDEIIDWNNFNGHIVTSGFIYSKKVRKFLCIYHKDLKMYLYPGGHMITDDENPLKGAIRETIEETGITDFKELSVTDNVLVPFDIDTHLIAYNERLDIPSHYHFDFRYLFVVDSISEVKIDEEEISNYKWITITELEESLDYGNVASKIKKLIV